MRARKLVLRTFLLPAFLLAMVLSCFAQDNAQRQRVLLLFTHQSDQPAQVIMEQAIRSTLQNGTSAPLEIYSEYLDAVRTPLQDYERELVVQLERKYGRKNFDVILVVNPPALKLLLGNRSSLFAGSPIVFMVLDHQNLDGLDLGTNITGVWGDNNYKSNVELALSLHPRTKRVVVISGVSEWDNYWRTRVQQEFRELENKVEISYLVGLSIAEQKKALAGLATDTIVLFMSSTQDNAGNNYGNAEVLREISPASRAPIYGSSDALLGLGIIGGALNSFEALGVNGAQSALRILRGEKAKAIAPHGVPAVPMFDWRELQRWGISEQQLPPGSIVRFKVPSFWELYRGRIIIALTILSLQSIFIGWLLFERKRRQRAKRALDQLNVELEHRITVRTAALAAKSRELETFAYSVAHDLKAPLRGIDGYSRLLLEDHKESLNDEGRSFLETIQSSSAEMTQLIEDLLDYSRLERRELHTGAIALRPLVDAAVQAKKREVGDRDIEFVIDVNGETVRADQSGLSQSLRNYLDNAIKFTRGVPHARIEVGSKETDNGCLLWVKDNGVGFDMIYHDRIFDIFQRLNRTEEYPGTGIGLAIVRKAMERMGGKAWAESEIGKGATFYLEIPTTTHG